MHRWNCMVWVAMLWVGCASALDVGTQAPDFALPDVRTGRTVSPADLLEDHQAVVVVFIATGCPYSNAFNHIMSDLARKYSAKNVAFVGVNSNRTEPVDAVRRHAEENDFPFPVVKDEGNVVADRYGAQVTPEVFLVAQNGEIVYHGALGNSRQPTTRAEEVNGEELGGALEDHLSGRPVAVPRTKAFGCTIKR